MLFIGLGGWLWLLDNLNGAKVLGRIVRVDHVSKYKKKEEEDEEEEQRKREARGVCRAFQRGECTRGASCKFSHNEMVRLIDIFYANGLFVILLNFYEIVGKTIDHMIQQRQSIPTNPRLNQPDQSVKKPNGVKK